MVGVQRKYSISLNIFLGVLDIADVSVLRPWSRLGDIGLLQPCLKSVGLGFSQAVDHYLNQEEDG